MSKMYFRILSAITAMIVIIVVFAGCGSAKGNQEATTQASVEQTKEASVVQPTEEKLKEVTLKFYFPGDKKAETDNVWNAIAERYKDQLNAKFDINFVAWGDYSNKMTILASSGDKWDMNFDANWNIYPKMVNLGAYLPLNELFPKYAPKLFEKLNQLGLLNAAAVDGKILAIPWSLKKNGSRPFLQFRADLVENAGLNYGQNSIKTIEDFDKFLYEAKKAIPGITIFRYDGNNDWPVTYTQITKTKYELCDLNFHGFVFDLNDPSCKLIPAEETEAYKEAAKYSKKWTDDGIIPKNALVNKASVGEELRNGKLFSNVSWHEYGYANPMYSDSSWKQEFSELYSDKKSYNDSPLGNLNSINVNAANPERTLMFLELLNQDRDLYDMVMYGIRDKTYVLDGEKAVYPKGMDSASSNYMDWSGQWGMWNADFMRPTDLYSEGFMKREAEFASQPNNVENKLDGIFFNTDSIKNEIAKRDQLQTQDGKLIMFGLVKDVDKAISDYNEKQKAAGRDKILAELQKQVDSFLASKK